MPEAFVKKMNNRIKSIERLYFITITVILVAVPAIYYFWFKTNSSNIRSPQNTSVITPSPASDFNEDEEDFKLSVLTRQEEGYEFAYPQSYRNCTTEITKSKLDLPNRDAELIEVFCKTSSTYMQIVSEVSNQNLLDWWYSLLPENKSFYNQYGIAEQLKFVNESAIQITYPKDKTNEHFNQVEILFHKNNRNYLMVLPHLACPPNTCWEKKIETQAFTTFRFFTDSPTPTPPQLSQSKDGCVISGCSSEICSDKEMFSTCELKPENTCFKTAVCEKQEDGKCGWTQTPELSACTNKY
jgi:hypothetical protein